MKMIYWIGAIAASIGLVVTPAIADQCAVRQVQRQVIQKQVVQKVVAAPVVVKQVVHDPVHYDAAQFVERIQLVAVEPQHYYSAALVGGYQREQNQMQSALTLQDEHITSLEKQVEALTSAVNVLAKAVEGKAAPTPPVNPPEDPVPSLPPELPTIPDAPTDDDQALNSEALQVLTTRCAKCHTGESSQGGFVIFESDTKLAELTPGKKLLMDIATYHEEMPKKNPLTTEEYSTLHAWVFSDPGLEPLARDN